LQSHRFTSRDRQKFEEMGKDKLENVWNHPHEVGAARVMDDMRPILEYHALEEMDGYRLLNDWPPDDTTAL
jgi:hypothetical protein